MASTHYTHHTTDTTPIDAGAATHAGCGDQASAWSGVLALTLTAVRSLRAVITAGVRIVAGPLAAVELRMPAGFTMVAAADNANTNALAVSGAG